MNIIKTDYFGDVESIRLGYGTIGPPLMSVFMYVVDGLVIDTGQHHMAKALPELLRQKDLNRIVLTHHHEDHSGNAALISSLHAIPVMGHRLTAAKMESGFPILPYQRLVWGKAPPLKVTPLDRVIETDRFTFTPVYTPGHSKDHTVFLEKQRGWLFSGDLYLNNRIKFFRSDERFADQSKLQFLEDLYGSICELVAKGFSEKTVIKVLDPKTDRRVKWITMGNASFANMVRSAMASIC
jgi:glyoxylase-like metal-dependent hydrolase (beta-lactamase superfamily II)